MNEEMKNKIIIRQERKEDYKNTEHMVMRAFWNLHGPGCNEHLLVRNLRKSDAYLPQISRVAELDGKIIGVIMYSKARVYHDENSFEVLSFGPLCVEPTVSNLGVGAMLLEHTCELAKAAGYSGICIFGEPGYYPKHGFKTSDNYGITDENGNNFEAFMTRVLDEEKFAKVQGKFKEDAVFETCNDEEALNEMNQEFPYYKPLTLKCQWLHKEKLGRICEIQKNTYIIKFWEMEIRAKLKGSLSRDEENQPVVGDYVTFELNPMGDSRILQVCERKSILVRPDQSGHTMDYVKTMKEQKMVSNFDYVFIMAALDKNYNYNRIARYVSITLNGKGIPVVVLTKSDMCSNPGRYVREMEGISDKVRVHCISALYGIGLEELNEYMCPGNTIVLIGSSGVGKSTLTNAIVKSMGKTEEIMKTSETRQKDSKGRHTTTYRKLITLENGVTIIDTPGMREIGMCDVAEGIEDTFSDITQIECQCKFSDCKHETEPGCAIKEAIQKGTLSKERYELYKALHYESDHSGKMKHIAKMRKEIKNLK